MSRQRARKRHDNDVEKAHSAAVVESTTGPGRASGCALPLQAQVSRAFGSRITGQGRRPAGSGRWGRSEERRRSGDDAWKEHPLDSGGARGFMYVSHGTVRQDPAPEGAGGDVPTSWVAARLPTRAPPGHARPMPTHALRNAAACDVQKAICPSNTWSRRRRQGQGQGQGRHRQDSSKRMLAAAVATSVRASQPGAGPRRRQRRES